MSTLALWPVAALGGIAIALIAGFRWALRRNAALQDEIQRREHVEVALKAEREQREQAQRALHESRRLEAIGRLASGIAHDFNNMLLIVSSHASELQEHAEPEVAEIGRSLIETVDRAVSLTRRLLVVGGRAPSNPEHLELSQTIRRFRPLLRRLVREDVDLQVEAVESVWVRIDPARLDQIVTNLVANACEASEASGRIRIVVTSRGERWAELLVHDDGHGMTPDQASRIFEPYYTTRRLGRGTGLGLATVHGAVVEAGGHVEVHSEVDFGTTITVLLPRVASPDARPVAQGASPTPPRAATGPRDGLGVLVVDDQRDVARSLGRLVASLGWHPHLASSAGEALAILAHEQIDVVVMDVVMPGRSGPDIVTRARRDQPDLAVLFVSGHADGLLSELGEAPLLRKPFSRSDLAEGVAQALRQVGH